MVRNLQAATTTGLRKNRVTQKTRLHVVRGALDADALFFDDEEERNRVLDSQGVDAEDANEHHLQAVLSSHRKHDLPGKQVVAAHIPIPDAAGLVEHYNSLYPSARFKQPTTHIRFSDSAEETVDSGLAGGFTYFLDEKDMEWLEKNNKEVRGEGTSASAGAFPLTNGTTEDLPHASTRSGRRGSRGKGKEPEHSSNSTYMRVIVDADELELVMGLFEKFAEEKFPYIHLALDNFPTFADYESAFAAALSPATFASYMVPASVPSPERLVLVAHTVYPHWKARRIEREGQRVVPQLDYDDSRESSYICFRRRDVKPLRRTRASSTAYTDKLTRLRAELHAGLEVSKMVLDRERLKMKGVVAAEGVWCARCKLVENWRSGETKVPIELLFDRERVHKKPKVEGLGRIILGLNRRATGTQSATATPLADQHSPLAAHLDLSTVNAVSAQGYVAIQSTISDRHRKLQTEIERDMASLRARDNGWEDVLDLPYQDTPLTYPERLFRTYSPPSTSFQPSGSSLVSGRSSDLCFDSVLPDSTSLQDMPSLRVSAPPTHRRVTRALRLRTGRGGRLHLDRRLHHDRPSSLLHVERSRWPRASPSLNDDRERDEDTRREASDQRYGPLSSFSRLPRKAHELGLECLAHESVLGDDFIGLGKRKRAESEISALGFEHCGPSGIAPFAEWEKGPVLQEKTGLDSDGHPSVPDGGSRPTDWHKHGRTEDESESAWRVEERWRYDSDSDRDEHGGYILDDFQPKFLRTRITLLDDSDHDVVMADAKNLSPPAVPDATLKPIPFPSRTEEGHPRRASLTAQNAQKMPPLQIQPPMLQSHLPFQNPPIPSTTPPLPLPQISSGRIDEQIRRMVRHSPSVSPTVPVTPQPGVRMAVPQAPPVTPAPFQINGLQLKQAPLMNGIATDGGATVRVSSPTRLKSHSPQQAHSQQSMGMNGLQQHQTANQLVVPAGHAHGRGTQQYTALRNVFTDRVPGILPQQQQQQQQQSRATVPMTHANVNFQMGQPNTNLKLSAARQGQLRSTNSDTNVTGQAHVHPPPPRPNTGSPNPAQTRTPSANGHQSATSAASLGNVSSFVALSNSSHHHSHLGSLHSSTPQGRPTVPLPHQPVVGGTGQGLDYS